MSAVKNFYRSDSVNAKGNPVFTYVEYDATEETFNFVTDKSFRLTPHEARHLGKIMQLWADNQQADIKELYSEANQ